MVNEFIHSDGRDGYSFFSKEMQLALAMQVRNIQLAGINRLVQLEAMYRLKSMGIVPCAEIARLLGLTGKIATYAKTHPTLFHAHRYSSPLTRANYRIINGIKLTPKGHDLLSQADLMTLERVLHFKALRITTLMELELILICSDGMIATDAADFIKSDIKSIKKIGLRSDLLEYTSLPNPVRRETKNGRDPKMIIKLSEKGKIVLESTF